MVRKAAGGNLNRRLWKKKLRTSLLTSTRKINDKTVNEATSEIFPYRIETSVFVVAKFTELQVTSS